MFGTSFSIYFHMFGDRQECIHAITAFLLKRKTGVLETPFSDRTTVYAFLNDTADCGEQHPSLWLLASVVQHVKQGKDFEL